MKYLTLIFSLILCQHLSAQTDTLYWPNGNVRSIYECEHNKCSTSLFYPTGSIKEVTVSINGFTWINEEHYCENGQLLKKHNPSAKEPELVKEYSCDGKLTSEYYKTAKGKRGVYKSYHETGEMKEQGAYEKTANAIGEQKVGLWEYYHGNGKKYKEAIYENGKRVSQKIID